MGQIGYEGYTPDINGEMLGEMSPEDLMAYIEDKSVDIEVAKRYGRTPEAKNDQRFLNTAEQVFARKFGSEAMSRTGQRGM